MQLPSNKRIKHLEDLSLSDMLGFLSGWNEKSEEYQISEKIDGNFLGFGIRNDRFYVRSRTRTFSSRDEIPNLFYMDAFRKVFSQLEKVPLKKIIRSLSRKHGLNFRNTDNIDIGGEIVPTHDHNIVIYDKKKVGEGIFLIFDIKIGETKYNQAKFWKDFSEEVGKHTSLHVSFVPKVSLPSFRFDDELVQPLREILTEHGVFLKKPARRVEDKEKKRELLSRIKEIGLGAKKQILGLSFQTLLGEEYEGLVITTPQNQLIKVVDKDKFTARKESNWLFINQLIEAQNKFKQAIKENPKKLPASLLEWEKKLGEIKQDFKNSGHRALTIEKKVVDTEQSIRLDEQVIGILSGLMKKSGVEEITQKYLAKEIVPTNDEAKKAIFKEVNSFVPKSLLDISAKFALKKLCDKDIKYELVGNTNRPMLGDIDIAIDKEQLAAVLGLPKDQFWKEASQQLDKQVFRVIGGLKQIHLLGDLIANDGTKSPAVDSLGHTSLTTPGKIQIDLFVGSLQWMKKFMSGAPINSKYKALYRNILLSVAVSTMRWHSKTSPGIFYRFVLDSKDGLKFLRKQQTSKSSKKLTERLISTNPDTLASLLFGRGKHWEDIDSFEKVHNLIMGPDFRFKSERNKILAEFKRTICKIGKEVPTEVEQE